MARYMRRTQRGLLLPADYALRWAATGGAGREEAERIELGDGKAVERLRIRRAQSEDGVHPVFTRVLCDVGAVVEGDVGQRLSV